MASCHIRQLPGGHRGSKSRARVKDDGVKVVSVAEAAKEANIVMILAPDEVQPEIYKEQILPGMVKGDMLMFSHGFNIHFGQIRIRRVTVRPADGCSPADDLVYDGGYKSIADVDLYAVASGP